MQKISKVAILDSKIQILENDSLTKAISISSDGNIEKQLSAEIGFEHGNISYLILKKYALNIDISTIEVLNSNGRGTVKKLAPAFQWCLENKIKFVNLSLGTTHFGDKVKLRTLSNHYTNQGIIIIAAAANQDFITYPAFFSNVIGVKSNTNKIFNTACQISENVHLGIEVLAPSVHNIIIENKIIETVHSNSYAAPFITALIVNLEKQKKIKNIYEAKSALFEYIGEDSKNMNETYKPDWIENAYIDKDRKNSEAEYYFNSYKNNYEIVRDKIDTIVIYSKEEYNIFKNENKNIVYLGEKHINKSKENKFIWSQDIKIKQILNTPFYNAQLDVPIVLIVINKKEDEFKLLTQLRKKFSDDGYNAYTVSFNITSVLYDLEFIPIRCLREKKLSQKLTSFLIGEIYYNQSDLLILGIKEELADILKQIIIDLDVEIIIKLENFISILEYEEKKRKSKKQRKYQKNSYIDDIYIEIINLFGGTTIDK